MARTSEAQVHPVDDVPRPTRLLAFGLQHVLAMYAGAVAVPLIVGGALGLGPAELAYLITADLLICGIATLIQCVGWWRFGARLPIMQGCTFAAVTPMVLIGQDGGLPAIYGSVIVCGLAIMLLAPVFGRLLRFFPPLVTGTVILIIGLSLLPVAGNWAAGGAGADDFGDPRHLALAGGVLLVILLVQRFGPGLLGRVAVLAGIAAGTAVSVPLGLTDFSGIADADWLGVSTPFHFGAPEFQLAAILSMLVVGLVCMTETTGDLIAVGELTGRRPDARRLADGLRADGFSTVLGGVFNTFPYTAYAQNVGLVALTRVRSRWVVAAAGALLVLLGLLPKLGAVVAAVPAPVLGGAGLVMFGSVAASGLRTLATVDFGGGAGAHRLTVVAVSVAVGLLPVGVPGIYERFPHGAQTLLDSGISAGCVTAIALNLLFHHLPRRSAVSPDAVPDAPDVPEAVPDGGAPVRGTADVREAARAADTADVPAHDGPPAPDVPEAADAPPPPPGGSAREPRDAAAP
ncbi:nucleobase:cation symporter-2 family protein [Streptomyces sp. AA0539]|uniref:nucleobase:cation symporter-2 family protein n=1 Tax=Streptomyces sp. AA0539 TaxID=1210045 RepID=UPI0002D6AFA6|nr:nucleobase:cation symporter-2 family protein [Streptomyces sp. AA0539]